MRILVSDAAQPPCLLTGCGVRIVAFLLERMGSREGLFLGTLPRGQQERCGRLRRCAPAEEWPGACTLQHKAGSRVPAWLLEKGGRYPAWPSGQLTFLPFLFQSALGFEYKGEVEKHSSQKGKSMGTCGPFILCPASLLLPISCAVCCGTVSFVYPPPVTCLRFLFPVSHLCRPIPCCPVTTLLLYILLASMFCSDGNDIVAEQRRHPHTHPPLDS